MLMMWLSKFPKKLKVKTVTRKKLVITEAILSSIENVILNVTYSWVSVILRQTILLYNVIGNF